MLVLKGCLPWSGSIGALIEPAVLLGFILKYASPCEIKICKHCEGGRAIGFKVGYHLLQ